MIFNNRRLNATEKQLYKEGKCICCRTELKPPFPKMPKYIYVPPQLECSNCYKARTRVHEPSFDTQVQTAEYSSGTDSVYYS